MKTPAFLFALVTTALSAATTDTPVPATAQTAAPQSAATSPASSPTSPGASSAPLQNKQIIHLWDGPAPGAVGESPKDIPNLTVFLPPDGQASGAAMVVFPGGGYVSLSTVKEGSAIAQWLASNGITAFVAQYRLGPTYHYPVEFNDGERAVRYVRAHAAEWKLDPQRIGVIGFSAGGHMASSLATHFSAGDPAAADPVDRVSSRPDLHILLYPVINMDDDAIVHKGSRTAFLGATPNPELMTQFSNEKQVTANTPPAYVVSSFIDRTVPIANSDNYVAALIKNNVPVVYLRANYGNHGFGLTDAWNAQCIAWLHAQKF